MENSSFPGLTMGKRVPLDKNTSLRWRTRRSFPGELKRLQDPARSAIRVVRQEAAFGPREVAVKLPSSRLSLLGTGRSFGNARMATFMSTMTRWSSRVLFSIHRDSRRFQRWLWNAEK